MSDTLYAWANPLTSPIGFLDHTWVTDYSIVGTDYKTIDQVPAGNNYWYCWGIYHPGGSGGVNHNPDGAIGSQTGNVTIAKNLVESMTEPIAFPGGDVPQNGAIYYYAVDGVCHMVANQVLFATGSENGDPLRVTEANGYSISSFFYGDYGLNTTAWDALVKEYAPTNKVPDDYFSHWLAQMDFDAAQVLGIFACREVAQEAFKDLHNKIPSLTIDEIYAAILLIIATAFAAVEKLVGSEGFLKLFPAFHNFPESSAEAAYWIDQDQFSRSMLLSGKS